MVSRVGAWALVLGLVVATSAQSAEEGITVPLRRRQGAREKLFERARSGRPLVSSRKFTAHKKDGAKPIDPTDKMLDVGEGEFVANITIGTPAQDFTVIMDTGSANIWVPGTLCRSAGCSKMHKFDAEKSSTYHNEHVPFILVYGTGSCIGTLSNDSVGLVASPQNVVIKGQTWGYADEVAKFFEQVPDCDGIWGMGMKLLQEPPTITPPLVNMAAQGLIGSQLFAVYLDSRSNMEYSEITWGKEDSSKYTGSLIEQPMHKFLGEWLYYMMGWESMNFNGKKIAGHGCSRILPCLAVVDTGTSLMAGPKGTIDKINADLNIAKDCSNFGKLPPVVIQMPDHKTLSIPSNVYIIKQGKECISGFYAFPEGEYEGFWIFGDPFLRSVYTVFDVTNKKFSFGKSVGPSKAAEAEGIQLNF